MSSFGDTLIAELDTRRIFVEPKIKNLLRRQQWLQSRSTTSILSAVGEIFGGAKVANSGVGLLRQWLAPSGQQIQKIREKLSGQRLVVLIDDLDRTAPELLPKFLLALREILDLPGFTFVLAFDDVIVGTALKQENAAWAEGQDFLEKILDFRFSLPPIGRENQQRLLKRALMEYADFVPFAGAAEVQDLMPNNPRKLKALVRGFRSIRSVVERHNPSELNWTDLWLVQLLQQESHILASRLADQELFNRTVGFEYKLKKAGANRHGNHLASEETSELFAGINLSALGLERAKSILEAMRSRSGMSLQYVCRWLVQPPAITWKEFDKALDTWKNDPRPEALEGAMIRHAKERKDSYSRIQEEVFEAISQRIDEQLDASRRSLLPQALIEAYGQARVYRSVARSFLQIADCLTAERLNVLYKKAQYWIDITEGELASTARKDERTLLIDFAQKLSVPESVVMFGMLAPWNDAPYDAYPDDGRRRVALRHDLVSALRPRVEGAFSEFVQDARSFVKLSEPQRYPVYKGLLFGEAGRWSITVSHAFKSVLESALLDEDQYANIVAFIDLGIAALCSNAVDISSENVKLLMQDPGLVESLWKVLRSRELLRPGLLRQLAIRAKLIEAGAPAESLPLDADLSEQVVNFEGSRAAIMDGL